ncbi:hypothetical protein ACHQM5_029832 [Ranunculus cassubicifolius]
MRGFQLGNYRRLFLTGAIRSQPSKFLCTSTKNTNVNKAVGEAASVRDFDAYRVLDKLDFMTAAKILFTTPPKKKKFGLDFHLVQLFFACMPSLAVYLVAQYARYEIKRMEAEKAAKEKKAEEEEKVKQMKALAIEEEKRRNDPELLQVKERLAALEQTLKGIVGESKKTSKDDKSTGEEKVSIVKTKPGSKPEDSSSTSAVKEGQSSSNSVSGPDPGVNEEGKMK